MQKADILRAWGKILKGERPSLSIEITRECPLRCPGCYAYEEQHLGGGTTLRQLNDRKGQELIEGVLEIVEREKPLHLSLVGGDPLVRYRELEVLVPQLLARNIHVQIVTSAFRPIPAAWANLSKLTVAVSVDGLAPEHDQRRKPATYDRILKNIAGQNITVHCTITAQMMQRDTYLREFVQFWNARPEVRAIWFSLFTPQLGDHLPEMLTPAHRMQIMHQLTELRHEFRKLDMAEELIAQIASPPHNPQDCVFARTTRNISADLKTKITPCQFGGNPDCSACGCIASLGLAAVAAHRLAGVIKVGSILKASLKIGEWRAPVLEPVPSNPFRVL